MDILKAFDKVWHKGLISKFHQNDNYRDLINFLRYCLSNQKERVTSNVHCFSWADICSNVSQGPILGSLLLLRCINDLLVGIKFEELEFDQNFTMLIFQKMIWAVTCKWYLSGYANRKSSLFSVLVNKLRR